MYKKGYTEGGPVVYTEMGPPMKCKHKYLIGNNSGRNNRIQGYKK